MKKILFLIFLTNHLFLSAQIKILTNFENSNVDIIKTDTIQNKIIFTPALKTPENRTRCWFYFGATGFDTSKNLVLEDLYQIVYAAPSTMVYSYNKKKWNRLPVKSINDTGKIYQGHFTKDTVWFAAGYPYTYSMALHLTDSLAENNLVDTSTLTYSEAGRRVPMLSIGNRNSKQVIWIIGRQHAFESTLNFFIEGMIQFFVSNNELARKFRKKYLIYIVPMMDVDNVYIGASGRMQRPIDFNRDWSDKPHWKAVAAAQKEIRRTTKHKKLKIFLDVHSTYPGTTKPLFGMFNEYKTTQAKYFKLKKFLKIFETVSGYKLNEINGNTDDYYADSYFIKKNKNKIAAKDFSSTIECDWNINNNRKKLTENELKKTGFLFAKALAIYSLKIHLSKKA